MEAPDAEPLQVGTQDVHEAVRGFKPGSAPGPSGLRGEHLKEAGGRANARGAATLGQLTRLVNLMAAGRMPEAVAPYFCGANLFAAKKKDGGLRPVAVGETLRRLVAKCLAFKVAEEAAAFLTPLQFGVGVQGGCEAIVHAARETLQDTSIPQDGSSAC